MAVAHNVYHWVKKLTGWDKFPLVLAIMLYVLIYLVRLQQVPMGEGVEKNIQLGWLSSFRQTLDQKFEHFLPSPQSQLLSGIVLGEKKDLPPEFRLALRDTSTLHIVVVSGQNLSMVAGFFLALSGLIKRRLAIALAFSAIIFYTLLTGAEVPVLRAAVMVTFAFLAQIFGRQSSSFWALALAGVLMLFINPRWLFDLSFQLSFMATMGLIVVSPVLLKNFKSLPVIGQDLAVTLGAQLMVIPIIAANFHQISLVGVFTNLMVGWTVPFIMLLGAILILLSYITFLAEIVALVVNILLTYFVYIVELFASLPFAWEYVPETAVTVWLGYYMVLAGVLIAMKKTIDDRG